MENQVQNPKFKAANAREQARRKSEMEQETKRTTRGENVDDIVSKTMEILSGGKTFGGWTDNRDGRIDVAENQEKPQNINELWGAIAAPIAAGAARVMGSVGARAAAAGAGRVGAGLAGRSGTLGAVGSRVGSQAGQRVAANVGAAAGENAGVYTTYKAANMLDTAAANRKAKKAQQQTIQQ